MWILKVSVVIISLYWIGSFAQGKLCLVNVIYIKLTESNYVNTHILNTIQICVSV